MLKQVIFIAVLILGMILSRRIFGDWGDGWFVLAVLCVGLVCWVLRGSDKGRRDR